MTEDNILAAAFTVPVYFSIFLTWRIDKKKKELAESCKEVDRLKERNGKLLEANRELRNIEIDLHKKVRKLEDERDELVKHLDVDPFRRPPEKIEDTNEGGSSTPSINVEIMTAIAALVP